MTPWICATYEISFTHQSQLSTADLYIVGLLGSIPLFLSLENPSSRNQESSPSFQDQDCKLKFFKNKISSLRTKRGQEALPLPDTLKKGQRAHQKEEHSLPIPATNMPTTRSQSKAMSTPPVSPVLEESDSPKSPPPLDNLLSPGWTHAITIIMGHPLKTEFGQMLQKWVLYHLIHDLTNFCSHGTLQILRMSGYFKNMEEVMILLPIYQAPLLRTI